MEDVVLHYQPGSEARLNSLLETTEKLLKPFPCRTPPVFTPWFSDSHFPIRPAKSAPAITSFHNRYFQNFILETKENLLPGASPFRRSWSVFTHKGVLLQNSKPLSQDFCHMVSILQLHLRQRVRWVISKHNYICPFMLACCHFIQTSQLLTCNANIQRERAEIWVFCDVVHSEEVGHFLKDKLQLFGKICLTVRRHGIIFSI
uniref:Uncharacterized protein n=1 Tax=Takifugu rubripes TaxID=31033 RepID=A0A674P5W2_TAKRU